MINTHKHTCSQSMVDNTRNQKKKLLQTCMAFFFFCRTQNDDVYTAPFHARVNKKNTVKHYRIIYLACMLFIQVFLKHTIQLWGENICIFKFGMLWVTDWLILEIVCKPLLMLDIVFVIVHAHYLIFTFVCHHLTITKSKTKTNQIITII